MKYPTVLSVTALVILSLVSIVSVSAETWKFGVVPDTQWAPHNEVNNTVSIYVIDAVIEEMIRQKVDIVLHSGDLTDRSSQKAFDTVAARFKPLADAGIGFYPIRGNHDSRSLESAEEFTRAFPNLPGTPGGKGSSPDLPGMAGMTYAFVHKNAKFVMLDTFPVKDENGNEVSYKPGDFQPWIDAELSADDHRHAFVVAHKNLIGQNHKDNIFTKTATHNKYPEMQNAFFRSLQENGVRYYLSGHDHMYYRARIKSPDRQWEVMQIICGACSHKFYSPREPYSLRDIPQAQELDRTSFMIFTVDDDRVTGEYYSTERFGQEPHKPQWKLRERFGYTLDGRTFQEQFSPKLKNFARYNIVP